jgi:ParB-like nuclease domain
MSGFRFWRRRKLVTVNWNVLTSICTVQPCAHSWVTDESITQSLEHLHFDDPAVPHHQRTHRANRIASIIMMIDAGIVFNPLYLKITSQGVHIADGHHRLRAFQYLKSLDSIPVEVKGSLRRIRHAIVKTSVFA